jgi:hypothetical protein
MDQEILIIFFYDVRCCSSYAFLRLERSLLRWRRTATETIIATSCKQFETNSIVVLMFVESQRVHI